MEREEGKLVGQGGPSLSHITGKGCDVPAVLYGLHHQEVFRGTEYVVLPKVQLNVIAKISNPLLR